MASNIINMANNNRAYIVQYHTESAKIKNCYTTALNIINFIYLVVHDAHRASYSKF